MPSSVGFSPHPCHWRRFIRKHGDVLGILVIEFDMRNPMILTCLRIAGTCPPNYLCSKQVWESWWTVYHTDNLLYTLYAADQVNTISIAL